jgi:hypothetical protein
VNRFRTVALAAIAGLVLVACSAATPTPEPEQSDEPSQAPQQSQGGPEPSFSEGLVADLEALIPDTVSGMTMQKTSMRGNEYLLDPDGDPAMQNFLQQAGVSPTDISMAFGFGFSSDAATQAFMFVIRASGAESNALLAAFQEAMASDAESPLQWSSANVGGKQVQVAETGDGSTYVYVRNDVVFWIFASSSDVAAEMLSPLP